ncbi:MAG: META domain-containing protein, partial [Anaerolineae bacterium]|nr:META domain-containing protein [Anaerolineae bacterium]
MSRLLTLGFILLLLAACGPLPSPTVPGATETDAPPPSGADPLAGTEWILTSLHGGALLEGSHIVLKFQEDIVVGFAGCNAYGGGSGSYTASRDGTLEIPAPAQTSMACVEPEGVMEQEEAYVEALAGAASYRMADNRLQLQDAAGETALVFARREPVTMDPAELVGTAWQLVTMDGEEPIEGSTFTLAFHGEGRASGDAGCRDYVMLYAADAALLSFHFTAMLGPVCDDPTRLLQEGDYTTILGWVDRYILEDGELQLQTVR